MQIEQNDATNMAMYQDLQALESIKTNPDSLQALGSAARQFEVQFLQQVLHSMREATEAISDGDDMADSSNMRFYQEMCDSQLAVAMAGQSQSGLQQQIVRQMSHALPGGSSTAVSAASAVSELKTLS